MKRKQLIVTIAIAVPVVIISLLILGKILPTSGPAPREGHFDLYIYTTGPDNTVRSLAPSPESGDIQDNPPLVYFRSLKNAYLYLLLLTPEKKMHLLFPGEGTGFPGEGTGFPGEGTGFPGDYQFTRYYLPENRNWEPYLKSPGKYTLSFLINTRRLRDVEKLLDSYAGYDPAGGSGPGLSKIITDLFAEIARKRREKEWIKNTGDVPEWIGSSVRGDDEIPLRAWSVPFRELIVHHLTFHYSPGGKDE